MNRHRPIVLQIRPINIQARMQATRDAASCGKQIDIPLVQRITLGASQYPSSSPRSSILLPMTRKPIELSHIEGHLNSLIAPGGVEGRGGRRLPEES